MPKNVRNFELSSCGFSGVPLFIGVDVREVSAEAAVEVAGEGCNEVLEDGAAMLPGKGQIGSTLNQSQHPLVTGSSRV
jgi:hypothetical protein